MKIMICKTRTQGSALLVCLFTAFVLGLVLASFLLLVSTENASVARSQTWNSTIVIAEAGVEDALQLVNKYAGTPNLPSWTNDAASEGWIHYGNGVYGVSRSVGDDPNYYYNVFVTNFVEGPTIYAKGHVPLPNYYAKGPYFVAAAIAQAAPIPGQLRNISVRTTKDPLFNFALAAQKTINMNGNNVRTDSFDSSNTNYSNADGSYNPSKNKDGGDVVSNHTITNTINIGNANIMGHARTGPNGTVSTGPNGSIGSKSWVEGGNSGAEPNWTSSDMNMRFENVVAPNATWITIAPAGGNALVNGVSSSFNQVYTNSTPITTYYKLSTIPDKVYIGSNVHAVIYITGDVSLSGQDTITIAKGGALTIYMGGTSFTTSGNGSINNLNKSASAFTLLGLPTCKTISILGNAAITGVIYAPQADLKLGGGGNNTYDFVGSAAANTVTMGGHMNFHYDEALKNSNFAKGYIPSDWRETF